MANKTESTLLQELTTPSEDYEKKMEEITKNRNVATTSAFASITKNAVDNMRKARAEHPNTTYCNLCIWTRENSLKFSDGNKDHYLNDLLNKGDLLTRLQNWFDSEHGEGKFMVYTRLVGKKQVPMNQRRYALTVSWDASRFDSIRENMERHREQFNSRSRKNGGRRNPRGGHRGQKPTAVDQLA